MKKALGILFILAVAVGAFAASLHSVKLSWTASPDSTAANPGTVNVYRAAAACPASGTSGVNFTQLATGQPAGGPYTDSTVTSGGTYCYYVTAVIGGAESLPSNTFLGVIPTGSPSGLSGVVQ